MVGGHRHGGGHGHSGGDKDPVCGMDIDPASAVAVTLHAGKTYYFCSGSCLDKFEQSPDEYLNAPNAGGHHM